MKKLILITLIAFTSSCEKVIEIETDFEDKRLVIDASISKHKDSINGIAVVKLSETIPYFSDKSNTVENALVSIKVNEENFNLNFDNVKSYYWSKLNNIENEDYLLSIKRDDNIYISTEKLIQTPKINSVKFGERKSLNEDEVEHGLNPTSSLDCPIAGDINEDYLFDATDINDFNLLLDTYYGESYSGVADMNGDGILTFADVLNFVAAYVAATSS